jgi:NAD(P)H-flavin reductase
MNATPQTAAAQQVSAPRIGRIVEVREMTWREKYFRLELPSPLGHRPGQFVMVSIYGIGEAPISISSAPRQDNLLELVVRKAGSLTGVFHALKVGDTVGVRGPFGSGFDLDELYGKDLLFVCGGLGLAPLRSLILPVVEQAHRFGRVTILSGCRNPAEELYRDEVKTWAKQGKIDVIRLVDSTEKMPWDGLVGLVTAPIPKLDLEPARTVAVLCGPPVMYKFVIMELDRRKVPHDQIYIDLERRMKCGVGKCGHCQINGVYCCCQGPVFKFSATKDLPEALS